MEKFTRVPKGQPVVVAYPLSDKNYVKSKGVSYTEDDTKIFIDCMVSGDTHEKGLSVISVENPKWCLIWLGDLSRQIHSRIVTCVLQGYFHIQADAPTNHGLNPTCPY